MICKEQEILKGGPYPKSCPTCGLSKSCTRHEELGAGTIRAVDDFAFRLKSKLIRSRDKKGKAGWMNGDWQEDCTRQFLEHVYKGDPLDVAAYAMFMWYHGWPTWPGKEK